MSWDDNLFLDDQDKKYKYNTDEYAFFSKHLNTRS